MYLAKHVHMCICLGALPGSWCCACSLSLMCHTVTDDWNQSCRKCYLLLLCFYCKSKYLLLWQLHPQPNAHAPWADAALYGWNMESSYGRKSLHYYSYNLVVNSSSRKQLVNDGGESSILQLISIMSAPYMFWKYPHNSFWLLVIWTSHFWV